MSILFYRRPDYTHPPSGPINESDCARYVERAKGAERTIPPGLSFEEVIENKPLPPCALSDFMDYLVYIEHTAENLQFYLWYQDYVKRFNALPENEKVLSPEWKPDQKEIPRVPNLTKDKDAKLGHRPTVTSPTNKFFDSMASNMASNASLFSDDQDGKSVRPDGSSFVSSVQGSVATTAAETTTQAGLKWQPFTIQPFRDECTHIIQHYLAANAPRELNLSHKDRHLILHALQHTSHPSSFLPAFKTCSAVLRGQSHPNFIRWSICNGNKPRVVAVQHLSIQGVILAFIMAVVLTLSSQSRWWRVFCFPLWFISFTAIVSAYKGVCIIMHATHSRELRPWEEVDSDVETVTARRNSASSDVRTVQLSERIGGFDDKDTDRGSAMERTSGEQEADAAAKVQGRGSRWLPTNLKTFGARNDGWEMEGWVDKYKRRSMVRKIFERETWTQDPTLRMLQDRIVYGSAIWAGALALCLTAAFVALPGAHYF